MSEREAGEPRLGRRLRAARPRPIVMALGILAAALAVLSLTVGKTEVALDAVASGVSFTIAERQPLAAPRQVQALAVFEASGLREVRFPRLTGSADLSAPAESGPHVLRLRALDGSPPLTLDPPIAAAGRRLRYAVRADGGYRLELECPGGECPQMDFQVNLEGMVEALVPTGDEPGGRLDLASPRAVRLVASDADAPALDLLPASGSSPLIAWQVRVSEISFDDREVLELPDAEPVVRRYSTLESGALRFAEVPGLERALHPGERLRLDLVDGTLHSLRLEDGRLRLSFSGVVDEVRLGEKQESAMPYRLQVLFAEEWFRFACGLIASALLIALGFKHSLEVDF